MHHRAQLRICHDVISNDGERGLPPGKVVERYCNLKAAAWCYDCDRYICSIHLSSAHATHKTAGRPSRRRQP